MAGTVAGSYRLGARLAAGGMGEVYEATHEVMGRRAAVKFLRPSLSANQGIVRRFFNEARAAAQIEDPGIVDVFDVGFVGQRAYIVMELLRGETLASRIRRGLPCVQETLVITRQMARVLGAAHTHSIVHRDLKPDNIFLSPDPEVPGGQRVKILDFGIAKLASLQSPSTTQPESVFGTPAYMAPEQCVSSTRVDHRADLYSIGCILYELLAGEPPFGRGGMELVPAQIKERPPELRLRAEAAPEQLLIVVDRLLAKNPTDRIQSCSELARQLSAVSAQYPVVVPDLGGHTQLAGVAGDQRSSVGEAGGGRTAIHVGASLGRQESADSLQYSHTAPATAPNDSHRGTIDSVRGSGSQRATLRGAAVEAGATTMAPGPAARTSGSGPGRNTPPTLPITDTADFPSNSGGELDSIGATTNSGAERGTPSSVDTARGLVRRKHALWIVIGVGVAALCVSLIIVATKSGGRPKGQAAAPLGNSGFATRNAERHPALQPYEGCRAGDKNQRVAVTYIEKGTAGQLRESAHEMAGWFPGIPGSQVDVWLMRRKPPSDGSRPRAPTRLVSFQLSAAHWPEWNKLAGHTSGAQLCQKIGDELVGRGIGRPDAQRIRQDSDTGQRRYEFDFGWNDPNSKHWKWERLGDLNYARSRSGFDNIRRFISSADKG